MSTITLPSYDDRDDDDDAIANEGDTTERSTTITSNAFIVSERERDFSQIGREERTHSDGGQNEKDARVTEVERRKERR